MKTTIYTLLLLLALTSCKKTESENLNVEVSDAAMVEPESKAYSKVSGDADKSEMPPVVEYTSQKIIKNANLRFEASDLNTTANTILSAVKKYKALVQSDSQNKDTGSVS